MALEPGMPFCLFLVFRSCKKQKVDVNATCGLTRTPSAPGAEGTRGTPGGPASSTCKKHLATPISHRGPRRERCAPSTSVPGDPAARPVLRRLRGTQRPRVHDMRRAGSPPPARVICSAAQLPAAAAPALPGARKAGIRCYHNKLNCSQQGPGK